MKLTWPLLQVFTRELPVVRPTRKRGWIRCFLLCFSSVHKCKKGSLEAPTWQKRARRYVLFAFYSSTRGAAQLRLDRGYLGIIVQ